MLAALRTGRGEHAVDALTRLDPIVALTRVLLPRMWELRGNLATYDCPLVTADDRLARAPGTRCAVEVV